MSDGAHALVDTGVVLQQQDWMARSDTYRYRIERVLATINSHAAPHPVWDFLFTYYSVRPGQLTTWHPGYGVVLAGKAADRYLRRAGYTASGDGVTVGPDYLDRRRSTVEFVERLLSATAQRPAQFGCFGLHEWAMVYRAGRQPNAIRHATVPLRLGSDGTDAVVEAATPLRCSHFDAFRFFTAEARGRNVSTLTRDDQVDREQPGCLHANMDLYKWCTKLGPLIESELLLDCLQLAADARELDMRASPYDLKAYGFSPIRIELPAGRAEYSRLQTDIAERAEPLRAQLIARCRSLLEWYGPHVTAG